MIDATTKKRSFLVNPVANLKMMRGTMLSIQTVIQAVDRTHATIARFADFDVDVFALLGMRNLSAFVGEIFAAQMINASEGLFCKNPHQDGYPDLLLMDQEGQSAWNDLSLRLREKGPFSPFPTGGLEVKATCGSLPTPAWCSQRNLLKPDMGDQRIGLLKGYDWKAHHQKTNHLLGLFWDFIDSVPHIIGVFYSPSLNVGDWGAIVQPREGGGRTTSVSIMTRAGVRKMCESWILMLDDRRYTEFFSRYNGGIAFR